MADAPCLLTFIKRQQNPYSSESIIHQILTLHIDLMHLNLLIDPKNWKEQNLPQF